MIVKLNGREEVLIEKTMTVKELIMKKGLKPERVAVEYNSRALPRERWSSIYLQDNDRIEIVGLIGGG
jgi:sulfur carrier protein